MRVFGRLFRLIWGGEVDRPLWPILAVDTIGSLGGGMAWTFIGIWAIKDLHAGQGALGAAYLVSALLGVGTGYVGGHLSDPPRPQTPFVHRWVPPTLPGGGHPFVRRGARSGL